MLTFSNSFLWSQCAASVHPHPAPVPLELERSEAQQEGEAAAWLANAVLRGTAGSTAEFEGETAPNGWPIDHAMIRHVQAYCDLVRCHGAVEAETELEIFDGRVRGRPDSHTVGNGDVLRIYELKYGYRIVEPQGNSQLLCAAIALAQPHHRLISLEVFQPRAVHANGPHRKWVINQDELQSWKVRLFSAAHRVLDARPVATVGDQCEFCDRRAACHALGMAVYADAERVRSEHRARKLTGDEIGRELAFLKEADRRLKARLSGIEAEANARAKREFIPGWLFDSQVGNRAFDVEPRVVQMLTGINPYKEVLKTPAEMEREGANPETIALLSKRPFIGFKLRPWDVKKVEKAFEEQERS